MICLDNFEMGGGQFWWGAKKIRASRNFTPPPNKNPGDAPEHSKTNIAI